MHACMHACIRKRATRQCIDRTLLVLTAACISIKYSLSPARAGLGSLAVIAPPRALRVHQRGAITANRQMPVRGGLGWLFVRVPLLLARLSFVVELLLGVGEEVLLHHRILDLHPSTSFTPVLCVCVCVRAGLRAHVHGCTCPFRQCRYSTYIPHYVHTVQWLRMPISAMYIPARCLRKYW